MLTYFFPSSISNMVYQGCLLQLWTRSQASDSANGPGHIWTWICLAPFCCHFFLNITLCLHYYFSFVGSLLILFCLLPLFSCPHTAFCCYYNFVTTDIHVHASLQCCHASVGLAQARSNYIFTLNPSFVIDAVWEIPKTELRHGTEIAKGQCGVSILLGECSALWGEPEWVA